MKKTLTTIALLLILNIGFGQQRPEKTPPPAKDSLTATTPLLSVNDVSEFIKLLSEKLTVSQLQNFQDLTKFLDDKIKLKITEWNAKNK